MSETTRIICAHCGAHNTISNASGTHNEHSPIVVLVGFNGALTAYVRCRSCRETYPLPIQVVASPDNLPYADTDHDLVSRRHGP